jgi:hypothetical protein
MAKQPIRSSGASGSGSSGAGGRSNRAQNVRQAAETALSQAKQAMDQWMREAMRLYGAVEASAEVAQSGRAVVFLASEEGGFITGSTLPINDGQYMMEGAAL